MSKQDNEQDVIIVGTSTIAADLHRITNIAWTVSLAAKNARIISAQAGELARRFQPITNHIEDITRSVLRTADHVADESVRVTQEAARHLKCVDRGTRFRRILEDAAEAEHVETLRPAAEANRRQLEAGLETLDEHLGALAGHLKHLRATVRSALTVSSICRIEASRTGAYRADLSEVAEDLERASQEIQTILRAGLDRITDIREEVLGTTGTNE